MAAGWLTFKNNKIKTNTNLHNLPYSTIFFLLFEIVGELHSVTLLRLKVRSESKKVAQK